MRVVLVAVLSLGLLASSAAAQGVPTKVVTGARSARLVPVRVDDGLKPRTYWLDPAFEIEFSDDAPASETSTKDSGSPAREVAPGVWLRPRGGVAAKGVGTSGSPAFRAGAREGSPLMALPGGVVVRFAASLSSAEARAWLVGRGLEIVREMKLSAPTFEIASEPGMASIELARTLLAEPEIVVASPNWWQEIQPN